MKLGKKQDSVFYLDGRHLRSRLSVETTKQYSLQQSVGLWLLYWELDSLFSAQFRFYEAEL